MGLMGRMGGGEQSGKMKVHVYPPPSHQLPLQVLQSFSTPPQEQIVTEFTKTVGAGVTTRGGRTLGGPSKGGCVGGYGNTNLLFPPNNIFQQKFNMATPNNFLNRYSSLSYGVPFAPWTVASQPLFAFPPQSHLAQLQQHLAFNYMQHHPYFALPPHPTQTLLPTVPTPPAQTRPRSLLPPPMRPSLQNKIQKTGSGGCRREVIQISDDSLQPQAEKSPQEKSASSTLKPPPEDCPIPPALIQQLKHHSHPLPSRQPAKPRLKPQPKIGKIKEIYKPSHHKRRVEDRRGEAVGRRAAVFSQRIIERKETKMEPYRLSKKERELLQIGLLREMANEIMTGPQFQARLPPFLSVGSALSSQGGGLQEWRKELRERLLERLEKNDD